MTEDIAEMRSKNRIGEAMPTRHLARRHPVAKKDGRDNRTVDSVRQNDGRAQNRLCSTFAARRPEPYARTTADNRIVSARRSRHDDRTRPRQRKKRVNSATRHRAPGAE